MTGSRPVASLTKTAAEDSSRPLRTRRQPCGGGIPWHLAGLGSFRVGYQQRTASSGGSSRCSCHTNRGSCHRRPRKCWQTGSRRRRNGLGSASLPGSSTREHRLFYSRNATQRDSHPSRPLCRLQRSDCGLTMRRDLRHGIAAPAPKQMTSRTDRPPSVDRISAPGPAVHGHTLVPVATTTAVSRL
jgi:hypothetical protein